MDRDQRIKEAADRLRIAYETRTVCQPVREILGDTDIELAYAVQDYNSALRIKEGAHKVGCKIGLTAEVVQKQLGVNQPDFGWLWNDRIVQNGGEISVGELMQAKAEGEIAFVFKEDLDARASWTVESILPYIDYAVVSMEIVGSRIENWNIKITDTIADNASASHFAVGEFKVPVSELDLINCKMEMYQNDTLVAEGKGSNCLDNPLNSLAWLANQMSEMGEPIKAGQYILTGALGPMVNINAGDHFRLTIEGLGEVSVRFTP